MTSTVGVPRYGCDPTLGGECHGSSRSGSIEQLTPGKSGRQGQCTAPLRSHKEPSFEGWSEGARWATLSEAAESVVRFSPLAYLMDFMLHTEGTARRTTSGQTLPLVVVFLLTLLLFCGAVIDIGNAYRVKQALQASADAAVAAGAGNLPNTAAASAAAHNLSAESSAKNRIVGIPNVTANITMDCSTSANFCNPANTVHITETANIPTYFLRLIGINTITESVHAQACSPCGGLPLDVMIVLDRTGSMSGTKLSNAKAGVLSFLSGMDPTIDNVGLVVLPPATSPSQACSTTDDQTYTDTTPAYLLVPLGNTYASSLGNLNSSSPLVSTVNCVHAVGGTAYTLAIDNAYQELVAHGRQGTQKVIVFLSDGAANYGPQYYSNTSPYLTNPCKSAVDQAAIYKAAKVLIYTIAYTTTSSDMCEASPSAKIGTHIVTGNESPPYYESPSISAVGAMQQIASPGNYYSNPNATSLTGIFTAISADIMAGHSRING
jgi:Flp pilus assembly protein TadG